MEPMTREKLLEILSGFEWNDNDFLLPAGWSVNNLLQQRRAWSVNNLGHCEDLMIFSGVWFICVTFLVRCKNCSTKPAFPAGNFSAALTLSR